MLSKQELNRYSRHIILPEISIVGQEKLKNAKVLVVGAGGLGCPVLQYLSAAGVGTIGIADNDVVDESNLHRQILFSVDDIGKPKADVAKQILSKQNPNVNFISHLNFLSSENALEIIKDYDIVADGSDNFPTRYLVNDACVILNKTLVFGSIFKFQGQVSVFNYKNGPTYRCLFPEPPKPGDSPNCAEIGVLGVLPGIIGTLMANETIKIIIENGDVLSGKLLVYDALLNSFHTLQFERNIENTKIKTLIDYEDFCGITCDSSVKQISVQELKMKMDKGEIFQLIDVREPMEHKIHNINGELIPVDRIRDEVKRIARDRDVILYCRSGKRSNDVAEMLEKEFGFTNIFNLAGGILEWMRVYENHK